MRRPTTILPTTPPIAPNNVIEGISAGIRALSREKVTMKSTSIIPVITTRKSQPKGEPGVSVVFSARIILQEPTMKIFINHVPLNKFGYWYAWLIRVAMFSVK
jgi:hypothetical protein